LIQTEEDEILFAMAEEFGKVFSLFEDDLALFPILVELASFSETVVREQTAKTFNIIQASLQDHQMQSAYVPIVLRLAKGETFLQRQTACHLFEKCYKRSGPHKEQLRTKFKDLCQEDTPMIRRVCAK